VDLARNRIALSMKSKPEIGPKQSGGAPGSGPRTSPGSPRPSAAPPPPRPPQTLTSDWFSAAMKKKH
jgi:uncharacterized protein